MVKLTEDFEGVPTGEIYPVTYWAGDDCPEELLGAAVALKKVSAKDAAAYLKAKAAEEAETAEAAPLAQEEADRKAAEEKEAEPAAAEGGNT